MAKLDYYEVLAVERSSSDGQIKAAFRKLAMQFHPDRNPGDHTAEAKFKEINEAYDVLKDPQKRAAYDRFGHAAFEQAGAGGPGFGNDFSDFMTDIFDTFFGDARGGARGARSASGRERGADLRYNLEITLEDAFAGKTETLRIPTAAACTTCSGSGAKPGSKPRQCSTCGGAGRVRAAQGFFSIERTCPACQGRGEVIDDPCPDCSGAGRITRERSLSVNIPAGVEDGTRIRLTGEGEAGLRGGPAGDLYIFLSVKPHPLFQRDGADLFCRVPISMVTAALGGAFEVPTVDGKQHKVEVPEGTQTGKQFRLRGKGMPILRSRDAGDLYIQVVVETPQKLTKRQRELLAEFDQESSRDTHPESAGFFSRVKDFFEGLGGST
ncbi:MAG: molecular chaperone DnaJ [Chelatococcus sp.]|uniref:molecular chaperone DnaJ n=1 Tax=unclassified Chelatococcus TaxID=2638111 RepID=UPI001BD07BA4|nr:molecular chaperone DnaJ [Chelatococcus sp.]MBS7741299.1 molecular chaperone DnaJ [Chelatococcus sp. HY11]CAH1661722.1 chaperone protein DnaJ [Hyphomicrobiales bacterium]MBX3538103.1 molecular chaperone DnaJ [Chelatococcus sp.]MBX3546219.1 molecular chaperone DnaJ [Chelatococcus sp.]MCO5078122.1 molecular chaperone DnaJ [Chelatococcus sp.]